MQCHYFLVGLGLIYREEKGLTLVRGEVRRMDMMFEDLLALWVDRAKEEDRWRLRNEGNAVLGRRSSLIATH